MGRVVRKLTYLSRASFPESGTAGVAGGLWWWWWLFLGGGLPGTLGPTARLAAAPCHSVSGQVAGGSVPRQRPTLWGQGAVGRGGRVRLTLDLFFLNPLQLGKCRCLGRPAVRDCAGRRRSCVVRGEVFVFGRRGKICVSFCPPSGSLAVGEVVRVTLPLCLCFCLECWTESGLGSGWFLQSAEQMEMTWLLVAAETKNTVEV